MQRHCKFLALESTFKTDLNSLSNIAMNSAMDYAEKGGDGGLIDAIHLPLASHFATRGVDPN